VASSDARRIVTYKKFIASKLSAKVEASFKLEEVLLSIKATDAYFQMLNDVCDIIRKVLCPPGVVEPARRNKTCPDRILGWRNANIDDSTPARQVFPFYSTVQSVGQALTYSAHYP
jgi:hypothetical protein